MDCVKWISVLLTSISILVAVVAYLAVTLPGRLETYTKDLIDNKLVEQQEIFSSKLSLLDIAINALLDEMDGADQARTDVYAIRHVMRLFNSSDEEKKMALRALQGMGRDMAYLMPHVEAARKTQTWSGELRAEYRTLLEIIKRT